MADGDIRSRIKEFAERFAEEKLRPYIQRLTRPNAIGLVHKEINDAVWGTIKVSPLEVVIIDSPLVQRLRLIRQLGVVHWIYPGASHSRFEHTLGVLHQAQQLIAAINQASGMGPVSAPINETKAHLVRLCALLHDIGHGVFSHVSEHALIRRPDIRLALQAFADQQGTEKVQLSELLAYDLIGSSVFIDLLGLAFDRLKQPLQFVTGSSENARHVASLAQRAIIGRHIDEQVPLLHEIITGPFDADKLDYYVRDAHHAGVPSLLDISRLLQKIVHRRVPMQNVPGDIKKMLRQGADSCDLFGLKWSGAAMLDELHLARVLLYAKIYRQKKVSAVEAMVEALFEGLGREPDVDPIDIIDLCYSLCDDEFIVSEADRILSKLKIVKPANGLKNFASDILSRLRNRDLYVTALALLERYPDDPWQDDKRQGRGLKTLAAECENAQRVRELRNDIAQELANLVEALPDAIEPIPDGTLDYGVVIAAKPRLTGGTEIDHALILQGDRFIRGRDMDRINQPAWADAYNTGSPQAHVFAPRETSLATFIAAERLIRRKYEVVLPQSAIELSKQDANSVSGLKRRLEAVGWYSGIPMDIRPKPLRLEMADIVDRVEALAVRIEAVDEPHGALTPRRAPQTRDRILSWLAQFRDDELIECALDSLEQLRILSREDTYDALAALATAHPQFKGATICPLGDLKDSGSVQAYLSRDLESIFPRTESVEAAAIRGGDTPIVFIDDFVGSGNQVSDMLGTWFDDGDLKQEQLDEARFPFKKVERDLLTSRPVAFVFVTGWNEGLEKVRDAAAKVGINATVFGHIPESAIPFAFSQNAKGAEARFKDRCRDVGAALLASVGKDEEKQMDRALGYGNRAMLLATRLNVPTQTLTCLWMDGVYDGVEWHALIRRRPKT